MSSGMTRRGRDEMTNPGRASAVPVPSRVRYDHMSIMLHWLTAALVVALWSIAQVIDFFPRGTARVSVRCQYRTISGHGLAAYCRRSFSLLSQ
jgi:hypothetical protein